MRVLPTGAWPVMLTPFHGDQTIDWEGVDAYTEWLIELGSAGLFTVALSSEMYELTSAERLALAGRVSTAAAGRVPVVASALGDGPEEIADVALALAGEGVDAIVLISSLLARPEQTDAELLAAVEVVMARTGPLDLGIYECPVPYQRLLSTAVLTELARTDRFVFYKDTCQDAVLMAQRIAAIQGSRLRHYNAQIASLLDTLRAGGHGFSGFAANVYPDLVAWLCAEHASAAEAEVVRTQQLLSIAEAAFGGRYPASAKYLLGESSRVAMSTAGRWRPETIGPAAARPLVDLARYLETAGLPGLEVSRRY